MCQMTLETPHPNDPSMEMTLEEINTPLALDDDTIERFARDGFVLLRNVLWLLLKLGALPAKGEDVHPTHLVDVGITFFDDYSWKCQLMNHRQAELNKT